MHKLRTNCSSKRDVGFYRHPSTTTTVKATRSNSSFVHIVFLWTAQFRSTSHRHEAHRQGGLCPTKFEFKAVGQPQTKDDSRASTTRSEVRFEVENAGVVLYT